MDVSQRFFTDASRGLIPRPAINGDWRTGCTTRLAPGQLCAVVAGSETRYLPYGSHRLVPTTQLTERDYTGQKENLELGLLYYKARFYVPGIGRFASADTIVPDPTNPQSANRYTYVDNRPLIFNDPTGHAGCRLGHRCVGNNGPVSPQKSAPLSLSSPPTPIPATPIAPPPTPAPLNSNSAPSTPLPASAVTNTASPPDGSTSRTHAWPDYMTLQGSWLIFSGSITMDTYSNIYGTLGGTVGVETAYLMGASIRLSAGYIVAEHYPLGHGPGPNQIAGFRPTIAATEAELEDFNRGLSFSGGGGFGLGADISISVNNSAKRFVGLEPGLYSPQLGVGANYGFFLYDVRDSGGKPFWELWFE